MTPKRTGKPSPQKRPGQLKTTASTNGAGKFAALIQRAVKTATEESAVPTADVTVGANGKKREADRGASVPPADEKRIRDSERRKAKDGPPDGIEVFFDVRDSSYWYQVAGNFILLGASDLSLHLFARGVRDDEYFNGMDAHKWVRWNAQMKKQVKFAGPLAGHKVGIYTNGAGEKMLVSDQASAGVWEEFSGDAREPEWFAKFIRELLPAGQWTYFCHWLALALFELRRGTFGPGQAVFLLGEVKCGKSLLQQIITEVLGGRVASPTRYLTGQTQFNADLAGAEHWMIEDPKTTTDMRARLEFGDNIKEAAISRQFTIHPKNKQQIYVTILRRLTASINTDKIARIPPIDGDIADKLFLFKCERVTEAFDEFRLSKGTAALPGMKETTRELDQAALWKRVIAELPLIRAWLLRCFTTVDPDIYDERFGVAAFHHPDLLAELSAMLAEVRLLQLIDARLFDEKNCAKGDKPMEFWRGPAFDLEQEFLGSRFEGQYHGVCRSFGQCGTYLGKLAKQLPERVSKLPLKDGRQLWQINNTSKGEKTND